MQPETYTLMHKMFAVASTKKEIEIVLRRFGEVIEGTAGSAIRDDQFAGAWARGCTAELYARLCEPELAEFFYREAIKSFEQHEMFMNAAIICVALATFYWEQGKLAQAEQLLTQNVNYLIRFWGAGNHHVFSAEEELKHFQLTGQLIQAHNHHWCKACGVDDYGVGFDFEDTDKAER